MIANLLAVALIGFGPQCGAHASYGYTQTYAASYAAPVYAHQQAYYTPVVKEIQFVAVQPYASSLVGGYARDQKRQEEAEETIEELSTQIKRLNEIIARNVATPAPVPAPAPAPNHPTPQGAPAYPVSPQGPAFAPPPPPKTTPLAPPKVQPNIGDVGPPPVVPVESAPTVTANRCASCHTGAESAGGFVLFDAPGVPAKLTPEDAARVDEAVISGRMPKNGGPLTLAEYRDLAAWLHHP